VRLTSLQYLGVADKQAVIALSPNRNADFGHPMPLCPVNPHGPRRNNCVLHASERQSVRLDCANHCVSELSVPNGT
jgi:hypothetical protein